MSSKKRVFALPVAVFVISFVLFFTVAFPGFQKQSIHEGMLVEKQLYGVVDINHATAEELMLLPGIGEVRATSIVEYRSAYGPFQNSTDLMQIPGISQTVFNGLKKQVQVACSLGGF